MLTINRTQKIEGRISVPGDKSISHRAVMLLAISEGKGTVHGFLPGADCLSTIACLRQLGVDIEMHQSTLVVQGKGLFGLEKPSSTLDCGNSGTTMRLLSGILAGQEFETTLIGDTSIQKRPMDRIAIPLRNMGAKVEGRDASDRAPLRIQGGHLQGIDYTLPVASAQVKSAILLAGLYAQGQTSVQEILPARDHTEIMLGYLGAQLEREENQIRIAQSGLQARDIRVPGDLSSAAFFIAAAAALPGSHLVVQNVGLNPTRTGFLDVLREMGAQIEVEHLARENRELAGDLIIRGCELKGTTITAECIPSLIDEIPILAVVASLAHGVTTITGAAELRVKESNRLNALVTELGKLGVSIQELPDGLIVEGKGEFLGGDVTSYGDHRIAMALAIAGLFARDTVRIRDTACIDVSFPGFQRILKEVVL